MSQDESPTLLRRQLGRFLREHREGQGLTIQDAAKDVQLSYNALQRLEAGRTINPRRQDVRELCIDDRIISVRGRCPDQASGPFRPPPPRSTSSTTGPHDRDTPLPAKAH